jgi:aspartate/methionine/tyrosine aminotransferase
MFSRRVPADQRSNRLSKALEEQKARGIQVLDLTESNPTRCGFLYDERAITRAFSRPDVFLYEPHPQGLLSAREAVAGYYRQRGLAVNPDSLFLTSSTSEAYAHLFKLLADPGGEVLVPVPGYPLLEVITRLEAIRVVPYHMLYDESRGWWIDMERLRATISTRTAAIAVVSPNNPTGSYLKESERAEISTLCRDFGLALLVDEVFSDYPGAGRGVMEAGAAEAGSARSAAGHEEALTFVLSGFSKILALPQMKLSWIHVSGPEPARGQAMEHLAYITDAFLSVSTPVQHAAADLLTLRQPIQQQVLARLEQNCATMQKLLGECGRCRPLIREGGWYAVLRLAETASEEETALGLLVEHGVHVHPGYFYDFPSGAHLVLSLLPLPGVFIEGVERIAARMCR